jgi:hypothetical protein
MNQKLRTDTATLETNKSTIKKYTRDVQFEITKEGHQIAYIQYDPAATQITLLEEQSPLFQPFLSKEKQLKYFKRDLRNHEEIPIDMEQLIQTDNTELKQQYI